MIQPVLRGAALLREIDSTQPSPGQVAIWWLGQSGYAIKSASALIYVDLYLSEHLTTKYANTEKPHIRMTDSPVRGAEIGNARTVFASHKHPSSPVTSTPIISTPAPCPTCSGLPRSRGSCCPPPWYAASLGLSQERLIPVRGEETLDQDGFRVHIFPSAHPGLDYSEAGGYPFVGFGFDLGGLRLYHSGDTIVYDGLAHRLRWISRTAARLPAAPVLPADQRRTRPRHPAEHERG